MDASARMRNGFCMSTAVLHVRLSRGLFAIVDASDSFVLSHKWYATSLKSSRYVGGTRNTHYARTTIVDNGKSKSVSMHRMIAGVDGFQVDHRDGNGLNNTRENLRVATRSQNQFNKANQKNSASQFKGVCKSGSRWRVSISTDFGKRRWSHSFAIEETSARAYDVKAVEWFGEFSRLNFPNEIELSREIVAQALIHDRYTALNEDKVREIRRMTREGFNSFQVSEAIGANRKTVQSVIQGRSWKHVTDKSDGCMRQTVSGGAK